ncbi:MAG: hydantoinase/oxoprolinase family protein [Syntrophomonadaceae bacterium]|nr:hydantoinase/oxoprolinase family protein [Syntrophomonadaceae bacterium]
MSSIKYRLGIDIGGTFTDITLLDQLDGRILSLKTPTLPDDPAQGIVNGLLLLAQQGIQPSDIGYFVHGTTIGLNTLLQRKGANIALFVTEGFRDLLTLQRLRLPVPYDFRSRLPEPLVPRKWVFPIEERMRSDGTEERPLDFQSLERAVNLALSARVQGVVLCFLHSYKNSLHEKEAAKRICELAPGLPVCLSSELWPEMREYERAVMAAINLYIQPNVQKYFKGLKERLKSECMHVNPYITQSNGGIMDVESAIQAPVRTLFSGPAAGVIGAVRAAETAGLKDVITFDMGGTSVDISVVENGQPTFSESSQLGGFPLMLPVIDIASIGAGGGSIGWIDRGGLLKVGPESVGSYPGPACYGRSDKPALTDAFLLCGYLNPERFAAGRIDLNPGSSLRAIKPIADYLQVDVRNAADRMIQIAITNMYAELRSMMEQHGFDPRDFSLVAFGGAGPVTANFVAEEIHAKSVLVPPTPGTLCALGSLTADFIYDAVRSRQGLLKNILKNVLRNEFELLVSEAKNWLSKQDVSIVEGYTLFYSMDARYLGQAYDIELPIDPVWLDDQDNAVINKAFHDLHQRQYGHSDLESDVEIINLRVRVVGYTPKPQQTLLPKSVEQAKPIDVRSIMCRGKDYTADIYLRSNLRAGNRFSGPAIVEQDDTTVLVLPGWEVIVDSYGNLLIQSKINKNFIK